VQGTEFGFCLLYIPDRFGDAVPAIFSHIDNENFILETLLSAAISHHTFGKGSIHAEKTLHNFKDF
jgi:hypothetical protein